MESPVTVGVLCSVTGGFYFGSIITGIARAVGAVGGRVLAIQTIDPGLYTGYEASLRAPNFTLPLGWSQIAGLICTAEGPNRSYMERFRATGKPIVMVSREIGGLPFPNVVPDNHGGIRAAVTHLVNHGHRRIAFVGCLVQDDIRERYDAYRKAMREHGIDPDPQLFFPTEDNMIIGGVEAGRAMLAAGVPSTAFVAGTDKNAAGVVQVLRDAGLSLPADQAVVGFDDADEAVQLRPALSTVNVHFDRLGELAAHLVLRQVSGEVVEPRRYAGAASLVIRESCGCCAVDPATPGVQPTGSGAPVASGVQPTGSGAPVASGVQPTGSGAPVASGTQPTGSGVQATAHSAPAIPGRASPLSVAARDRLRSRLKAVLAPESDVLPSVATQLSEATEAAIEAVDQAVHSGAVIETEPAARLAAAFYTLGPRQEAVKGVIDALRAYVGDPSATGALPSDCRYAIDETLLEISLAVSRAESRDYAAYNARLETTMVSQYDVGMSLLRADREDPAALSWLDTTNATFGCLGLWTEAPRSAKGALEIAGVYGRRDPMRGLLGERVPVESFPPTALLERADAASGEVAYAVQVKTDKSRWGVLTTVGPIDLHSVDGRETNNQWTALLAVALEQRHQRDALTAAYHRERELVEDLRVSEERYALAARAANDGLWDWNLADDTIFYSERFAGLLGHAAGELGASPREWLSRVHPDDRWALQVALRQCRDGASPGLEQEHRVRVANGSYRWMLCRGLTIGGAGGGGGGGSATRMVGSLTDIDDRKRLEEQLRFGALYDGLTGLANRTLFLDRLAWAIEHNKRRPEYAFAVLFCDLDDFKVINDSLGHITGDLLLTRVAARIVEAIRGTDVAARLGGDEFAILLNDVELAEIPEVVARVQEGIGAPFDLDGHEVVVTVSIGVAVSAAGYEHPADVLRDADTAMYQAKSHEPGTHEVFDVAMHAEVVRRLRAEVDLRQAFERHQFELHYQPLVDLDTAQASGFEALLRWRHPERGYISPAQFLEVAEKTGLILPLGQWIIDEVCRQIAAWRLQRGPVSSLSVNVNVSNRQFWHGGLLQHVQQALRAHRLEPHHLRLEITEGVIMYSPDQARRTMEELHRHGLRLHIDDFGTGYSSLESLHRFPIEALKIDRSFVAGLGHDGVAAELVRAIVTMGRAVGVDVVAEGVETEAQARMLRQLGCHRGQGFHYSRPLPGAAAGALIGHTLPAGEPGNTAATAQNTAATAQNTAGTPHRAAATAHNAGAS